MFQVGTETLCFLLEGLASALPDSVPLLVQIVSNSGIQKKLGLVWNMTKKKKRKKI